MTANQPTKELVERVKAEDKRDVESKYMAPYFGIAPSLLDEIRAGKHDGLLFTPKPKPEVDGTAALNGVRSDLNRIERKMDAILMALDVKVVE